MNKLSLSLTILLPLAAACASNPALHILDGTPRPAKTADSIKVVSIPPQQPFETIATWSGTEQSAFDDTTVSLRYRAIHEAARLGADAVILSTRVELGPPTQQRLAESERELKPMKIYSKYGRAQIIVYR